MLTIIRSTRSAEIFFVLLAFGLVFWLPAQEQDRPRKRLTDDISQLGAPDKPRKEKLDNGRPLRAEAAQESFPSATRDREDRLGGAMRRFQDEMNRILDEAAKSVNGRGAGNTKVAPADDDLARSVRRMRRRMDDNLRRFQAELDDVLERGEASSDTFALGPHDPFGGFGGMGSQSPFDGAWREHLRSFRRDPFQGFPRGSEPFFTDPFRDWPGMNSFDPFGAFEKRPGAQSAVKTQLEEKEDAYVVRVEAPGANQADLKITLKERQLTISGQREEQTEAKDEKTGETRNTITSRSFSHQLTLPGPVDEGGMRLRFKDGEFVITVPKSQSRKKAPGR